MSKIDYLNVGCGDKYHKDWVNIDMRSYSPKVCAWDLFKGIPFNDDVFEVVYLSQVLEHFPKEHAPVLIRECYRVLKANGIIRIVVPDLEDMARTYLKLLEENLNNPTVESAANYDWMLLELYDQTVRNVSGGEMAKFLKKPVVVNEQFILKRSGFVGKNIRDGYLREEQGTKKTLIKGKTLKAIDPKNWAKALNYAKRRIADFAISAFKGSECLKIGKFRLGGEIHYWIYDRYSLGRLLKDCGFQDIKVKSPGDSDIPEWNKYELDIRDGQIYDPTSLFMEAKK